MVERLSRWCCWLGLVFSALAGLVGAARADTETAYLAWRFEVSADAGAAPLLRELSAEVSLPSHQTLKLPAFPISATLFEVRCRADQVGAYTFMRALEGGSISLAANLDGETPTVQEIKVARVAEPIQVDPKRTRHFLKGDAPYIPVGANLPWAEGEPRAFYQTALAAFGKAELNWARVWMVHWGSTNLTWNSRSEPSDIEAVDSGVAETWDRIVSAAESHSVALQVVLQHHGQISTGINANWQHNPWNAENPGGFLHAPVEFFTHPRALQLTRAKYRYIVARWGYSASIMAWELFNEIHNTEVYRASPANKELVASWHAAMAKYLRGIDVYGHLITTSVDDLDSAAYQEMDYYQPHCYAANMLAGPRALLFGRARAEKPAFYGECGDDQLRPSPDEHASGASLVPPVWSGLMGDSEQPPQVWYVERLMRSGKLSALTSVARFIRAARVAERVNLKPFNASTTSDVAVPLGVSPALWWHRHPPVVMEVPLDGREPEELALFPRTLVGNSFGVADGFPDRVGIAVEFPAKTTVRIAVEKSAPIGGSLTVLLDGERRYEHRWIGEGKSVAANTPGHSPHDKPVTAVLDVSEGHHTIELRNESGPDWIQLGRIDLGVRTSALGAVGRRNDRFLMLWLWNRTEGVTATPIQGRVQLGDVAAGRWRIVWWDTDRGEITTEQMIQHAGGTLDVPTPEIARHAAVFLECSDG